MTFDAGSKTNNIFKRMSSFELHNLKEVMKDTWFLLVGDDGRALTSVDRVTLPSNAVVVDLRDAVKEKKTETVTSQG
ncbi:CRN domain containing hypothetical protein-containing protein [Phytophthora palmivora]|uniref:Uncharacterized protein n=1 Tax=Phytophthora palmivora TaxID=4796 RepID=A0A2P4WYN2_9STRA|nr:CRN domain containing hypothetical protein-containing protein [Phytophthora palmivora]